MRLISILLSVVTLVYLSLLFVNQDSSDSIETYTANSPILVIPAYISDAPLEVEKVWQQLKAERIKAKQPVKDTTDKTPKNKDVLTLGENKYALYGIFNANEKSDKEQSRKGLSESSRKAFILIKALSTKGKAVEALMLKVVQGGELSKGVTLVAVTSNSISFNQDGELIEFKLFEAKK
ncbi:MAG: hypothetical protein GY928_31705 [Colwellia sp.]|nr:hypothetical protein [Colwellia sp.]